MEITLTWRITPDTLHVSYTFRITGRANDAAKLIDLVSKERGVEKFTLVCDIFISRMRAQKPLSDVLSLLHSQKEYLYL